MNNSEFDPPAGPPKVPVVQFMVRYGDLLAVVMAVLPIAFGFIALGKGYSWIYAAAGIIGGILGWLFTRSYVELVRIIADTLLPR